MSNDKSFTRVDVPFDVSESRVSDLLVTAFEGGIGYWAQIRAYRDPNPGEDLYTDDLWSDNPEKMPKYANYPLTKTGAVILADIEGGIQSFVLDREALLRGFSRMQDSYPSMLFRIVKQDPDFYAFDADVFIQIALFGDIVYW